MIISQNEIILVGGGGHCKSCIDVIEAEGKFIIKGIIDLPELLGTETLGYPIIGSDNDLPVLVRKGYSFLVTMGHMGETKRRDALFMIIKTLGGVLPSIVSPKAQLSSHAKLGYGSIIMHGAVVNADSQIGENCIINNLSLIEHDSQIDDHCHISTGAIVNGNCHIGFGSFIGSGCVIKNGLKISSRVLVGMGSCVVNNIDLPGLYFGNPAKKRMG